jgi:hypothetical protein
VGSGSIVDIVASASLVPSHRRELQTAVNTVADLTSALANTAVGRIVLASGTYYLTAELSITRSVILEAAAGATVTLNAQATSSSPRRVLIINPGPSGVVKLIGLNITGGYVDVRAHVQKFPSPLMGESLTRLPRLSLAQLRPTLRATAQGVRAAETSSHRPDGKIADMLAPTHACTTANASVNYRMYVPQRP